MKEHLRLRRPGVTSTVRGLVGLFVRGMDTTITLNGVPIGWYVVAIAAAVDGLMRWALGC